MEDHISSNCQLPAVSKKHYSGVDTYDDDCLFDDVQGATPRGGFMGSFFNDFQHSRKFPAVASYSTAFQSGTSSQFSPIYQSKGASIGFNQPSSRTGHEESAEIGMRLTVYQKHVKMCAKYRCC
jgi:hypothetical protein